MHCTARAEPSALTRLHAGVRSKFEDERQLPSRRFTPPSADRSVLLYAAAGWQPLCSLLISFADLKICSHMTQLTWSRSLESPLSITTSNPVESSGLHETNAARHLFHG